jgi:hypothetical protein
MYSLLAKDGKEKERTEKENNLMATEKFTPNFQRQR